jgi:hypothetical protein
MFFDIDQIYQIVVNCQSLNFSQNKMKGPKQKSLSEPIISLHLRGLIQLDPLAQWTTFCFRLYLESCNLDHFKQCFPNNFVLVIATINNCYNKKNCSGEHNSLHFPMKYSIFETEIPNLTLP